MTTRCRLALALVVLAPALNAQSLQTVVDRAKPGDTLVVPRGVWVGDVVLRQRIALMGSPGAVIRGGGAGSCVTILADSCRVEGFIIEHSGNMLVNEDANVLVRSRGNTIARNTLRDGLFGVYLFASDGNEIRENTIEGRARLDVGQRGSGVHVWNSNRNRIVGNSIRHARDGFYIQYASHTWIEGNDVSDLRYGLHYMYADSNTFVDNVFHHNVAGAAIMYSRGIIMRHNAFVQNRGVASYGILFQDCHDMRADSNIVADNAVGMFFEASTGNRFRRNLVAMNDVALQIFSNSTGNTFTENAFIDNLSPLTVVGKRTESRWSENGRGNYWSTYRGYDFDGDGIGDVPVKIQDAFNYLEGRYPQLRVYLSSIAAEALAAATNAFPILALSEEVDEAPLMHPLAPGTEERGVRTPAGSTGARRASLLVLLVPVFVALVGAAVRKAVA